jgi:IS1 family transposase
VVWNDTEPNLLGGMIIDLDRAEMILGMLCEGSSVRAVARLTSTDPHTVIKLLVLVGKRCKRLMARQIRNLIVGRVQCDEVWQFIYCKEKTATKRSYGPEVGDSYLWTGIERDTKLILAWHLGKRTAWDAEKFCDNLLDATHGHFQLSTDAFTAYPNAIARRFSQRVDYGQVVKIFGSENPKDEARRYSPARIMECRKKAIFGDPDKRDICTSHVERHNLSLRTFLRRMTRLAIGFSKKWENHEAAVALCLAHYNFCRIHRTLKTTPAVAHGVADAPWTIRELIEATAK